METFSMEWSRFKHWAKRDQHKRRVRVTAAKVERAFTTHPHEAGETYFGHLIFTLSMTMRLLYGAMALLIHGLFPFLCTKTASTQMEKIWLIMRSRIPQTRRDEIIRNWDI